MKKFKCEEIMCGNCVSRIDKALTAAEIEHQVDLNSKTVTIEGCEHCEKKAVEILDDLGFSAVEVEAAVRASAERFLLMTVTCARSVPLIV